ncbi:MAG: outer-membrane lipoprotein carrier protein LolA [Spirochaetia bacterium]
MRTIQNILISTFFLVLVAVGTAPAQDIMTSSEYFEAVSDNYSTIEDYEAEITITKGDEELTGTLYYKSPNLLRIDFEDPEDQVMVVNNDELLLHLPQHHVVMQQKLESHSEEALATMANSEGLQLLKNSYSIAFLDSPQFVPLDEDSDESVRKLKMEWRTPGEGFRQIIMSVNEDMLIRRMEGLTADYEEFHFDFEDITINQGIPSARFEYESPPSAYNIENFLFTPEN